MVQAPATCKDVASFTANVLPNMRGAAGGFNLNCASCHGNGLAGLSLNGADQTVVCNQVLSKLNTADITKSLIITQGDDRASQRRDDQQRRDVDRRVDQQQGRLLLKATITHSPPGDSPDLAR